MIRNATTTRHLPAEPQPDSRWSTFAQGVRFMTEKARASANGTLDAARIVFTSKTTWAIVVGAILLGMWVENVRTQALEAANASRGLTTTIEGVRSDISEIRGSLNVLMQMQSDVSKAGSDIRGLESRLDSFDGRLQTMDAWIQTTRDRLNRQGFDAPPYNPGQNE